MAIIQIPPDFKEFLQLLNSHQVEYLLIGGYAVGYHGYPRATGDMDIWIKMDKSNAQKMLDVLKEFGFDVADVSVELFQKENQIIRMGVPPLRIDIATTISGVTFDDCFSEKIADHIDGIPVNIIDLKHLKINKKASGRHRDIDDLEHLL